ncbi:MAG: SMC-Scp complex subunit ScpB [Candidatus Eiseniibacteriota bacterium]
MDTATLKPILEALLFAADVPLPLSLLAESCETDPAEVAEALSGLAADYDAGGRGVRVAEMAGGYVVLTREDYAPYVARMLRGKKKARLSRPALEALAIIAYKQPVTKVEVDAIRGVDSSGVLNTLLERELVTIRGRSKVVGRPLLYGTTGEFLSYFGLRDLTELPRVEELKAIVGEREPENPEAEPETELPLLAGIGLEGDAPRETSDEGAEIG